MQSGEERNITQRLFSWVMRHDWHHKRRVRRNWILGALGFVVLLCATPFAFLVYSSYNCCQIEHVEHAEMEACVGKPVAECLFTESKTVPPDGILTVWGHAGYGTYKIEKGIIVSFK